MMGHTHAGTGLLAGLGGVYFAASSGHPLPIPEAVAACAVTAGFALLPDIDHHCSMISRSLRPLRWLYLLVRMAVRAVAGEDAADRWMGHRRITHTFAFAALVGGVTQLAILRWGGPWWLPAATAGGCLAHVSGDCCTDHGCPVLAPLTWRRWRVATISTGSWVEGLFAAVQGCASFALLLLTVSCTTGTSASTGATTHPCPRLPALNCAAPGTPDGYSRAQFGDGWAMHAHGCDTRELVLIRQGVGVRVDAHCHPTAGSWTSPYDQPPANLITDAREIDIDHVVPLREAWRSGARTWTPDRRHQFANDLERPQLVAVTFHANRSKGDSDPAEWMPIRADWCTYATSWITVKTYYKLTADPAEATALRRMLDTCATR